MSSRPTTGMKTENFDMDSLFDFNQSTTQQSPMTASSSHQHDLLSPYDDMEERHQYGGPSHDYNQYKQQVGLPVGSMVNMPMSQPQMFDSFNSGIDTSMDGFYSGIDIDADLSMDFNNPQSSMPAMFFPDSTTNGSSDNFINPNAIQEEPAGNVGRLWPGMHSQQARTAAMQKQQQAHAMQQRQMKLQAQHAHYRQVSNASQTQVPVQTPVPVAQNNGKRPVPITEPHVEESISRLLNQMRHQSAVSDEDGSADDNLPHIARLKKDEDDMDEDERLLNSDEGKKLSSKERRQLRNKVSARAFRSRRKEYISQLEGELALKAQESNSLRQDNSALMQENERYRGLIETLLRHPAFTPFINDISKDPAVLGMPQQQTQHLQPPAPTPAPQQPQQQPPQQQQQQRQSQPQQDVKPEFLNFDAGQLEIPSQQTQQQQINLAMIPEENFSKLNLNNGLRNSVSYNGNHFGVNAYAVTDLPPGPDPRELLAASYDFTTAYDFDAPSASDLLARLDNAARRT